MKYKAKMFMFGVLGLSVAFTAAGAKVATAGADAAAEKRCSLMDGTRVVCPVKTDEELKKAQIAYEKEGNDMMAGQSGSTYGIAPFDYLTGVGKHEKVDKATFKTASGYSGDTGKTELWDRVKAPKQQGDALYNQWTNNWSPTLKESLVAGADPNEGKQWYYVYCVGCHGWLLHGDGPNAAELSPKPRILTDGSYMNNKSNLQLFQVIKGGGEAVNLSAVMPPWGNELQDQDIWNLVAWLRAMADVKPITSLEDYLNPKSSFKPIKDDVTALNAAEHPKYKEVQEMIEASISGRGGAIKGAGFVQGGSRKTAAELAKSAAK
ncbi:MAG: cytochrome c [Magnetococcus sp. YQC-5]